MAGGGDEGARAGAHGGARFARPVHVPGRAGHEAGGAGGAATPALAGATLGAAAAAAAAAPEPGKPSGGPGLGGGRAGTALASLAPARVYLVWGLRGERGRGVRMLGALVLEGACGDPSWPRTPATEPSPFPGCPGLGGGQDPGALGCW